MLVHRSAHNLWRRLAMSAVSTPRRRRWLLPVLMHRLNRNCIHRQENRELVLRRQIEICVKDCFDNYLLHNMGASRYPMAERLAASGFPVKCETRSWRSISVVLSEELRRPWRRSPKTIQIVELVQLQRNCPDWEGSQSPVPEVR